VASWATYADGPTIKQASSIIMRDKKDGR
jgi:hypothetical protein